jgi:phosphoesterase RecJ-like protein
VIAAEALAIAEALIARRSFVVVSHARPDGDAIGSAMAMALALEATGRQATVVTKDPVPGPYQGFPYVDRIRVVDAVTEPADAVIVLECGDLARTGVAGLDQTGPIVNIDHHPGNTGYGTWQWFDAGAAACGEMVATLIDALAVDWTPAIATHLYLALSTDTGSFRYGPVSAHTFDICRRVVNAGVDTSALSRAIYESYSIGRVRLTGALLDRMTLHHDNRLAILAVDDNLLAQCGATNDDLEGLVNLPLGAREVVAVAMLKRQPDGQWRVSLRSKGAIDVRMVATQWQGGGHQNASGFTATGAEPDLRSALVASLTEAIDLVDGAVA